MGQMGKEGGGYSHFQSAPFGTISTPQSVTFLDINHKTGLLRHKIQISSYHFPISLVAHCSSDKVLNGP